MSDMYADDHDREMAKWAHNRLAREREEQVAQQRDKFADIYEGYYPEED